MNKDIAFIESTLEQLLPLATYMDVKITQADNETYSCLVPLNANTKNHFNSVHAALQWAGAELLGGIIWFKHQPSDDYLFVLKSMNIQFLKPAMTNVTASAHFSETQVKEMHASLADNGRYDFDLNSEISNENGEVVVTTQAQYAIRRKR